MYYYTKSHYTILHHPTGWYPLPPPIGEQMTIDYMYSVRIGTWNPTSNGGEGEWVYDSSPLNFTSLGGAVDTAIEHHLRGGFGIPFNGDGDVPTPLEWGAKVSAWGSVDMYTSNDTTGQLYSTRIRSVPLYTECLYSSVHPIHPSAGYLNNPPNEG